MNFRRQPKPDVFGFQIAPMVDILLVLLVFFIVTWNFSLNEKERRQELADSKSREDKRTAARAKNPTPDDKDYLITLDNVDKPSLQLLSFDTGKKTPSDADADDDDDEEAVSDKDQKVELDPIRDETLNILTDFIDLNRAPRTASK